MGKGIREISLATVFYLVRTVFQARVLLQGNGVFPVILISVVQETLTYREEEIGILTLGVPSAWVTGVVNQHPTLSPTFHPPYLWSSRGSSGPSSPALHWY